jgi:uncharacterized membrane protein
MQAIIAAQEHFHGMFDGRMTWFWPVAVVLQIAFWVFIVWLVLRFARPWLRAKHPNVPERILAERFAEGTINEEDYRKRLEVIRTSRGR